MQRRIAILTAFFLSLAAIPLLAADRNIIFFVTDDEGLTLTRTNQVTWPMIPPMPRS